MSQLIDPPVVGTAGRTAQSPARGSGLRRRFRRWKSTGGIWAIVLALPLVLAFAYFSWGPIVRGAVLSFMDSRGKNFVGFDTFAYVLSDPLLPVALWNTLWFTILALILGFPVPLFLAIIITDLRRSKRIYSLLAYLPVVVPPVAGILLWKFFYDPSASGLFNTIFGWFGLGPFPWLNDAATAMPSIVLEATWATAGNTVIIYMAALVGVRAELYDAAELDGAGIWSRIWNITFPQIRGVILVMLLLQIIGTMQVFSEPFLFTNGGPNNSTLTILLMIYNYAFGQSNDIGAATALSVLLALMLAIVSVAYLFATRKWNEKS